MVSPARLICSPLTNATPCPTDLLPGQRLRPFRDTIQPETLKVGNSVIIIGEPNDQGQITANLVRIMPTVPDNQFPANSTTSSKTTNI